MPRPLKVFRTPIGFHDAYVAATSRKAALQAWGAEKDLFASGSAEQVSDPALTAAPLATPGEVIKLSRGDLGQHLRAASHSGLKAHRGKAIVPSSQRARKQRPSRGRLDKAEAARDAFEARAAAERAVLDEREAQLLTERRALNTRQGRESRRLDDRLAQARDSYEKAMERWRAH